MVRDIAAPETESAFDERENLFFGGISRTLRFRGGVMQRLLCALLLALLTGAQLPMGGYCCQIAMFAVLLRLGFCVTAGFAGVMTGFVVSYGMGNIAACWQMPACTMLWLLSGLWVRRQSRGTMAAVVFFMTAAIGVQAGMRSVLGLIAQMLTAVAGAGLSVLYDGAAMSVCHRDELDGQTRPLCVMAVCASVVAGLLALPGGGIMAMALAMYLTLEHAHAGGGVQALLCSGILGGVLALWSGRADPLVMLMCGGFLSGELRTGRRSLCALLQLLGMAAAGAVLGGEAEQYRLCAYALAGAAPFLVLPASWRSPVTGLVERADQEEMTQSEAVAVRCASMVHAWAGLYEETAQMMQALSEPQENPAIAQCVQLLRRTGTAAHQVCERTLSEIRPDDEAYRRLRYALVREGFEQVRVAYAIRTGERMEVLLLKPEALAPSMLAALVTSACGVPMRACTREGLLCTQALFEQTPRLMLDVGAATRSRSGEEVAGDSYMSRTLPGGRHILALSDGMGSGEHALEESHAALSLLAQSLKAGYTHEQALETVNALMLMCMGREMYATMDLMLCDLHSGETVFEKLGACASYVVREGEVRTIGSDTLPMGVLESVEAQTLRMTLHAGDTVVMLTDGVCDAYPGGEEALCGDIRRLGWLHPQAIGEKLIARALEMGEARDDMAVLCIRVGHTGRE